MHELFVRLRPLVAGWEDVRRVASGLPEVTEDLPLTWRVRGKPFVHERPLRPRDLAELGAGAPTGPVLGVRLGELAAKEAALAEHPAAFTTSHFSGYAMVLVDLHVIPVADLRELVEQAWLAKAPPRLGRRWLTGE